MLCDMFRPIIAATAERNACALKLALEIALPSACRSSRKMGHTAEAISLVSLDPIIRSEKMVTDPKLTFTVGKKIRILVIEL